MNKKNYFFEDAFSARQSQTPANKNSISTLTSNLTGKSFKANSTKKNNDLFESKNSITLSSSRTTTYSSYLSKCSGNNFNNKCKQLLDQVINKPQNDMFYTNYTKCFDKDTSSKSMFPSKFIDIKSTLKCSNWKSPNGNISKPILNGANIESSDKNNRNYESNNNKAKLFLKEISSDNSKLSPKKKFNRNMELLFPKKNDNFISNITYNTDKSLTLNSQKIPTDLFGKIKKTLPEYLNKNDHFYERSDNKVKIERMKEKVNKFFK